MRVTEQYVEVPDGTSGQQIRAALIRPVGDAAWPGAVFYTDIFQLTPSTLRMARRVAGAGFVVCVPEIYPHGDLAGVALAFDDEGKVRGQGAADGTPTADFDVDRTAVLDYLQARPDVRGLRSVGWCIGGHLAFRAALDPRVAATVCYYPTGLQDGSLGADVADSLERAGEIRGALMVVFGSADPHVPAEGRLTVIAGLQAAGIEPEVHVYAAEHAFMRDEGPRHDPLLTDAALAAGMSFLSRV